MKLTDWAISLISVVQRASAISQEPGTLIYRTQSVACIFRCVKWFISPKISKELTSLEWWICRCPERLWDLAKVTQRVGSSTGNVFHTAWPRSVFLFPCTTSKRKMVREIMKGSWKTWRKFMPRKMAEPGKRSGSFLCPNSPINHVNMQPDKENFYENSPCDPPHPIPLKIHEASQRLLKWFKIFPEDSFRRTTGN